MKSEATKTVRVGTGPAFMLALLFIGLKLTGHIAWSWWWVLSPLWIPFALVAVFLVCFLAAAAVAVALEK